MQVKYLQTLKWCNSMCGRAIKFKFVTVLSNVVQFNPQNFEVANSLTTWHVMPCQSWKIGYVYKTPFRKSGKENANHRLHKNASSYVPESLIILPIWWWQDTVAERSIHPRYICLASVSMVTWLFQCWGIWSQVYGSMSLELDPPTNHVEVLTLKCS